MKKIIGAFIKDDTGEVNLLTVMITLLMAMFLFVFVKAEVFNQPVSEIMTSAIVQLISIAFGGVGAIGIGRKAVDFVNQSRVKKPTDKTRTTLVKSNEVQSVVSTQVSNAYDIAKQYVGLKEIEGDEHNPKIMEWVNRLGFQNKYGIKSDEVAWCATFANGVLLEFGLQGSGSPRAKSFLDIGTTYNIGDELPNKPFAIVAVSHRGYINPNTKEGSGHVELVDPQSITESRYSSIGGNVSDQVKSMNRTYDKFFIEFRVIV